MGLGSSRELLATDNDVLRSTDPVLSVWRQQQTHNKKSKRAAVSSDGNQLAPVKKKRRIVKEEEEEEEEESPEKEGEEIKVDLQQKRRRGVKAVKKEEFGRFKEEFEDDLHQDTDVDSRKPPAAVKEEKDEPEDTKPPAAIKEEEGYGYETDENEELEWEDSKKPPAAVKKEVEDAVGSEYSPSESDEESNGEDPSSANSQMARSDEDEFGRGIESDVDDASDTSDSVDGIVDQDDTILGRHDVHWNIMYERLRAFKDSHGDCELFWAVHCFTFIWNAPTNSLPVSLPELQVTCHNATRKYRNWEDGSIGSALS
jgi:hypothetical protein